MLRIVCSDCALEQPEESFAFKDKARGVRRSKCRSCQAIYTRQHYLKNRALAIERAKERNKVDRARKREIVADLKSRPCADCGQAFPWYVMEFDHRNPEEKTGNIGILKNQARGMPSFLSEVAKCDILCANCHKTRTYERGVRLDRVLQPAD